MMFSKEFLVGISLGSIGLAGVLFLFSKQKNRITDEYELKNKIEDLEDETDGEFFDAETGSSRSISMPNGHLHKMQLKSVKESYKDEVEKQAFRDLKHYFELCNIQFLEMKYHMSDAVQMIQHTVNKQELMIDSLKSDMTGVNVDLNRLIKSVGLLKTEMTSAERNSEKPDSCKIGRLKTRISILEREVTENCSKIIGMDSTFRTLLLTRGNSGLGTAVADEIRVDRSPSNTDRHQPTKPNSSSFTLVGPPPVRSVPMPPPPPPPIPFGFDPPASPPPPPPSPPPPPTPPPPPPPPPPAMTMTTRAPALQCGDGKKTSKETGPQKNTPKTYSRILITEEILKSVVLKPVVRRT